MNIQKIKQIREQEAAQTNIQRTQIAFIEIKCEESVEDWFRDGDNVSSNEEVEQWVENYYESAQKALKAHYPNADIHIYESPGHLGNPVIDYEWVEGVNHEWDEVLVDADTIKEDLDNVNAELANRLDEICRYRKVA